ncbi:hypothetical protein [Streptomyces sp. NPDC018833]
MITRGRSPSSPGGSAFTATDYAVVFDADGTERVRLTPPQQT